MIPFPAPAPHALPLVTRAAVWAAAFAVWLLFGWALLRPGATPVVAEPPAIVAVRVPMERAKPDPPPPKKPPPPPPPAATVKAVGAAAASRPAARVAAPQSDARPPAAATTAPRPAPPPAPASPGPPAPSGGAGLSSQARALLRARDCLRVDLRERPPDCPPDATARRMIEAAQGPAYRPENAEAFSRNEKAWRGVPPPCLPDGVEGKLGVGGGCVRLGDPPSRVRGWQEICEARGLGNCTRPDQAAVERAKKAAAEAAP
jgi:hypothetical protein